MDKGVEEILKWIPFTGLVEKLGLGKEISDFLSLIVLSILVYLMEKQIRKTFKADKARYEELQNQRERQRNEGVPLHGKHFWDPCLVSEYTNLIGEEKSYFTIEEYRKSTLMKP